MSDYIRRLEIKKLMKELEFYESDYEYKNSIVEIADKEFLKSVSSYFEEYPELNNIFQSKMDKKLYENLIIDDQVLNNSNTIKPSSKIRKLYREIVKRTHPDKISDKRLNELYLIATKSYDECNVLSIYGICNDLNISYDLDESDIVMFNNRINTLKNNISFIQSTYTWKWNFTSELERKNVILDYIRALLKR